jgi:hypothetical protein
MIGIPLGLLYANAMEWVIHKHVLHGLGKNKKSFWSFHWHEHHNKSRTHDMHDDQYAKGNWRWNAKTKEVVALAAGAAVFVPLFPVAPFFTATVWWSAARYYRMHKRAHVDPAWAKEHLAHHVDHHMGPNQHMNWCVTHPFFDYVMGTRQEYVGTERHADDERRRAARLERERQTPVPAAVPAQQAA